MRRTVTREDYFDAALTLLAQGSTKLKITSLCKALNITTGSFYGYFGSIDGFVTEFLRHWEQLQTDRIADVTAATALSRRQFMKELTSAFPYAAEAGVRSWAHTNARVAKVQKRIDERRITALAEALRPSVDSRDEAQRLAVIGMALFVGLRQVRSFAIDTKFDPLFDEFERVVEGRLARSRVADDGSGPGRPA